MAISDLKLTIDSDEPTGRPAEAVTLRLSVNARPRLNTVLVLLGFKPWITVRVA